MFPLRVRAAKNGLGGTILIHNLRHMDTAFRDDADPQLSRQVFSL